MAPFNAPVSNAPALQAPVEQPQAAHAQTINPQKNYLQEVYTEELHHRTLYNRIEAVISHISWYGFKTQSRLAADSAVSKAAISRLIHGKCQPSLTVALQVTRAIETRLGRPLSIWELFSLDGTYPTASVCELMDCRNCLSQAFYDNQEKSNPNIKTLVLGSGPYPSLI